MLKFPVHVARFRLIFLLAFLVSGCELLFGIKESTSSGAGGGASGSSSTTTISSSGSSSTTTTSGSTGSGTGSCATADAGYFFCADFDEGGILGPDGSPTRQWDGLDQTAGGPIDSGLDDAMYVSEPASLEVVSPPMPAPMPGSVCQSSRVKKVLQTPDTVQVDFDFYPCDVTALQDPAAFAFVSVDCQPDTSQSTFGVVKLGASQGAYALDIFGVDGSADVGTPSGSIPIPSLADAGWTHVHIEVTFGDHGPVTLVVGDQKSTSTANTSCPGGHSKALSVGILACGAPTPACTVHFDNVLVYADP
jgi:hypothetical protein